MGVIIIGAGIGGLTLGLALYRAGILSHIYEAAPAIAPIGVGINLLPHAIRQLAELNLEAALARVGVSTAEACFFNRFGQLIYREPLGRAAGYCSQQFSIHRGDLQQVLADAFVHRAGADHLITGWRCIAFEQTEDRVSVHFENAGTGDRLPLQQGAVAIGCDGIHSVIRKQLYPDEGEPLYSGYKMWRGVTRWPPFLSGASMVQAGWLATGKMVIYPMRNDIDGEGRQLVNWVAEIETPRHQTRDWNRRGALADFFGVYKDWRFDWLDVPAMIGAADMILEFPMVDVSNAAALIVEISPPDVVKRRTLRWHGITAEVVQLTRCAKVEVRPANFWPCMRKG